MKIIIKIYILKNSNNLLHHEINSIIDKNIHHINKNNKKYYKNILS